MFDTRLIHLIVDCERRMEIENEKKGNPRVVLYAPFSNSFEPCHNAVKSFITKILKINRGSRISTHSYEPDGAREHPVYNAS